MTSKCAVQPTKQDSWFSMDHLAEINIPSPLEFLSHIKEKCIEIGAFCGLILAMLKAVQLLVNLFNMSRLYFQRRSTIKEAFNLTFNYVGHSRREYIRDNSTNENNV